MQVIVPPACLAGEAGPWEGELTPGSTCESGIRPITSEAKLHAPCVAKNVYNVCTAKTFIHVHNICILTGRNQHGMHIFERHIHPHVHVHAQAKGWATSGNAEPVLEHNLTAGQVHVLCPPTI